MPRRREALIDAFITEVDRYLTNLVGHFPNTPRAASAWLLAVLHEFSTTVDTAQDCCKIWLIWKYTRRRFDVDSLSRFPGWNPRRQQYIACDAVAHRNCSVSGSVAGTQQLLNPVTCLQCGNAALFHLFRRTPRLP